MTEKHSLAESVPSEPWNPKVAEDLTFLEKSSGSYAQVTLSSATEEESSGTRYASTKEVKYQCIDCLELIAHHHKDNMLREGTWKAGKPGAAIAGFQISALYAPIGIGDD